MGIRVGATFLGSQFFRWERFEEAVVEPDVAPQSAEAPLASGPQGNELGDRLAIEYDHDLFAALDLFEKSEEVGFPLIDVDDNWHEGMVAVYRRIAEGRRSGVARWAAWSERVPASCSISAGRPGHRVRCRFWCLVGSGLSDN